MNDDKKIKRFNDVSLTMNHKYPAVNPTGLDGTRRDVLGTSKMLLAGETFDSRERIPARQAFAL